MTPAPKHQGNPSIALQSPSDECEDMKDHIIRNMFPLGKFSVNEAICDRKWAAFYLGEEGETFKRLVMSHQIPKTQPLIEAVRTRLEHLKHNVSEFC